MNKPIQFFMVRHGRTLFNQKRQMQGWCDAPLLAEGVEGAKRTGERLKDTEFVSAYSSDLRRAMETARYILACNQNPSLALQPIYELREQNYGIHEGDHMTETFDKLFERKNVPLSADREAWRKVFAATDYEELVDYLYEVDSMGTAENYDMLSQRLMKGYDRILSETQAKGGGNVLIVAHGGMLQTSLRLLTQTDYKVEIRNCSVTILTYDGDAFSATCIDDVSHHEK